MKNLLRLALCLPLLLGLVPVRAQVLFQDDFNRSVLTGGSTLYTTTLTNLPGNDGGARLVGGALELTNDLSSATNVAGRVMVTTSTSAFSGFQQSLADNAQPLRWSFNARYNRTTNPGGFDANLYSLAVVLGATGSDLTLASGYAVVYGNTGTPDPIRLVRFTGGLDQDSKLTTLISSGGADLAAVNNFFSVGVNYFPTTNQWQLFVRDDGASAWGDPRTVSSPVGQPSSDATFTQTPLTHAGFLWNYNTAASQSALFDNFQLAILPEPKSAFLLLFGLALGCGTMRRYAKSCCFAR